MIYVYVIRSRFEDWYYTGQTKDLKTRIDQHNSGKTRSTKSHKPFDLVYFETLESREDAVNREKYLKSGIGREFLKETIDIKNASVVQLDTCLPAGREYQIWSE
ncbi:MAG: GIY-YIG nuclease family protein [Cyclobacteriaceae bacterium]